MACKKFRSFQESGLRFQKSSKTNDCTTLGCDGVTYDLAFKGQGKGRAVVLKGEEKANLRVCRIKDESGPMIRSIWTEMVQGLTRVRREMILKSQEPSMYQQKVSSGAEASGEDLPRVLRNLQDYY